MKKFILLYFFITLLGLSLLSLDVTNDLQQQLNLMIVQLSIFVIHLFDNTVILEQTILRHGTHNYFGLEVTSSCNALSLTWLSVTAFFIVPTNWKMRIFGGLAILLIVQTVNILRIIILLYIGRIASIEMFNFFHEYFFILILHLSVITTFFVWLQWLSTRKSLNFNLV